jgi:hypothetical protein
MHPESPVDENEYAPGGIVSPGHGLYVHVQNQYDHAVNENLHPTRTVKVGELSADIDEELAPIVEVIWRLGLTTWTSCQNAGESNAGWPKQLPHMAPIIAAQVGWAYVDFPIDDGLAFLTALAQAGPRDAFYLGMRTGPHRIRGTCRPGRWTGRCPTNCESLSSRFDCCWSGFRATTALRYSAG